MKKIAIVGATGSIGQSALEVIKMHPQDLQIAALIGGSNAALLARQVAEFCPAFAALADAGAADSFRKAGGLLPGLCFYAGADGIAECLSSCNADICLSAAGGAAGLRPTLVAIEAGMEIALANKESLVAAGDIIMPRIREKGSILRPVDSEHSALAQCLRAGENREVTRLLITGSGGAFRDWPREKLAHATPANALNHPTWSMGKKITVDSATLANKALEVIEAHHLFNMPYEKIKVLIHPQSVVHGAVEFADGALIAQMASPDMRLPILYALTGGERRKNGVEKLTLNKLANLTFSAPDMDKYPLLRLGLEAGKTGGLSPAVFSAANEVSVELFLAGKIPYPQIVSRVENALANVPSLPVTLENILAADAAARELAYC